MVSKIENGSFVIDGKPTFLFSGEIHYFRTPRKLWEKHLKRAREAGLNTVSSYIPWSWHEPKEGLFDFSGKTHPQRDLLTYLKLVKKYRLKFSARIGPVANAEMNGEGIPLWLIREKPEILAKKRGSDEIPKWAVLAYNNKTLQNYITKWYEKILPIIKENEWPNGSIVFIQLCNEIGMMHWLGKIAEYSEQTENMYQSFLREKYKDISLLNEKYKTNYSDFSQIIQPDSGDDSQNMNMLWDWMKFYQQYYAKYYYSLFKRYSGKGLKLPVLANIPQFVDYDTKGRGVYAPLTTMMFRDFPEYVPEVIFGGAYQMRRLDWENFQDVTITSEVVKTITSPGVPIVCAELQSGIMRDWPRLYPADVELNLKLSAGEGLNGLNCYMFSGGVNEFEYAGMGTYHEWQAVVSSKAEKRSHFKVLENFGGIIKTFGGKISVSKKDYDTAFGYYPMYYTTEYFTGKRAKKWEKQKHSQFFDGFARLLQLNNINLNFIDLLKTSLEELKKQPSLCVFSIEFMDENTQTLLLEYVKAGGNLILNPQIPAKNLNMEPCTILADGLGVRENGLSQKSYFFVNGKDCLAQGEVTELAVSGDAKVVAKTIEGNPSGVIVNVGKGKALVLGFALGHIFDYHIGVLGKFAKDMGITPGVSVDKDIKTTLRKTDDFGFLFVMNFHDDEKRTKVKMVLPGEKKPVSFPKKGDIIFSKRGGYILPLNVPLKSGDTIRYSSAEVTGIKEDAKSKVISVRGDMGSVCEMELITKAKSAKVDGKPLKTLKKGKSLVISFVSNGKPQKIEIK